MDPSRCVRIRFMFQPTYRPSSVFVTIKEKEDRCVLRVGFVALVFGFRGLFWGIVIQKRGGLEERREKNPPLVFPFAKSNGNGRSNKIRDGE